MPTSRRFRIASSLARILRRERGIDEQIAEGHFPSQRERGQYVSIARDGCNLVLTDATQGGDNEQRTEIPRSQAEALLEVCSHRIAYGRTRLQLTGAASASADYFVKPGSFDLLSVVFDTPQAASSFIPPAWFGPEVTENPAFGRRSIALLGLPEAGPMVSLSDATLHALLNMLDQPRPQAQARNGAAAQPPAPPREAERTAPEPVEEPAPVPVEPVAPPAPVAALAPEPPAPQPSAPPPAPEDEQEPQPVDLDEQASGEPGQPPAPKVASGRSGWDFRRSRLTVHP